MNTMSITDISTKLVYAVNITLGFAVCENAGASPEVST